MIPDLPDGISADKILDFYSKLCGNLQDQSSVHTNWFTHRRNPSVCWICDMNIMSSKLIELANGFITKSAVDLETTPMSEDETEAEIESLNYDEETPYEPEYETE